MITVEPVDFVSVPSPTSSVRPASTARRSGSHGLETEAPAGVSSDENVTLTSSIREHRRPFDGRNVAIALRVPDVEAASGSSRRRASSSGRDLRHRRLPHGVLPRPRREHADAAPEVRTP